MGRPVSSAPAIAPSWAFETDGRRPLPGVGAMLFQIAAKALA